MATDTKREVRESAANAADGNVLKNSSAFLVYADAHKFADHVTKSCLSSDSEQSRKRLGERNPISAPPPMPTERLTASALAKSMLPTLSIGSGAECAQSGHRAPTGA